MSAPYTDDGTWEYDPVSGGYVQTGVPALVSTDANGNTVLVGGDGTEYSVQTQQTTEIAHGNSVIIVGDSITAQNESTSSLVDYYQSNGYFNYANIKLGWRLNLVRNAGVNSDTTTLVLARLAADVIAYKPKCCVVLIGINDIYAGAGTYDATVANLQSIYEQLIAANILVVACTITPPNSAYASYSTAKRQVNLRVNNWIRNYARLTDGVVLCDMHAAIVDPSSATGSALSDALYDNLHLSNKGAYLAGNALYTVLDRLFAPCGDLIASNVDNYGADSTNKNILDNGLFLTAGGTGTGTIAAGWTVSAASGAPTHDGTHVARSDGFGNNQVLTIVSGAAGDRVTAVTADLDARVTNGESLVLEMEITSSSSTNLRNLQTFLFVQVGGQNYFVACLQRDDTNNKVFPGEISGVFRTKPLLIPAGTITLVQAGISCSFAGIGGTTLTIGRASLRKVE